MFTIQYSVLDAALRDIHRIRNDKAGLLARYKYFQRHGFPDGVNAGRGKAATFGIDQILQLLFAFDLVETGCGPTRVMRIVRTNWPELRSAFAQGWLVAQGEPRSTKGRPILVMDPSVLEEMNSPDVAHEPVRSPFIVSDYAGLGRWLDELGSRAVRVVVDPASLVFGFRDFLARHDDELRERFDAGFWNWTQLEVGIGLHVRRR